MESNHSREATVIQQFTVLYKVILAFDSLHKNLLKCDQWNKEPLYWYLQTLILLCVFCQIIHFSGKIITHQEMFSTVMLLVNSAQPQQWWNKKVKKAIGLLSKTKTLNVKISMLSLHNWCCQTWLEWQFDQWSLH